MTDKKHVDGILSSTGLGNSNWKLVSQSDFVPTPVTISQLHAGCSARISVFLATICRFVSGRTLSSWMHQFCCSLASEWGKLIPFIGDFFGGSCSLWMVWFSTKTWWINKIYNKKVCFLVMLFYWLRENYPFLTLYDSLVVARLLANDLGIYSIGQQHPCYACSMQALLFSHVSTSTDHFWLIVGFYPPCYHYEQSLNKAATPHTRSRQRDPPQSQPQAESAWRYLQRQRMVLRIIHRQVKLSHADLPAPGAIGRPVWCKPGWVTL